MSARDVDPGRIPAKPGGIFWPPAPRPAPLGTVLSKGRFHAVEYRIRTCKLDTEGLPSLLENGIGFVR